MAAGNDGEFLHEISALNAVCFTRDSCFVNRSSKNIGNSIKMSGFEIFERNKKLFVLPFFIVFTWKTGNCSM